jgi:hypothetical protein
MLAAGPAVATTEDEDVDGGPPGECWRDFWQRPPPKLQTSMAEPLGVLTGFLAAATTKVVGRRWRAPWGVLPVGPAVATTEVEDVNGAPWGVLAGFQAAATTEVARC